jgi:hypothetical protein
MGRRLATITTRRSVFATVVNLSHGVAEANQAKTSFLARRPRVSGSVTE